MIDFENGFDKTEQRYYERIGLKEDLTNISRAICKEYSLDDFISNEIITTGYEDFNYILETTSGKYVVKILAKQRKEEFANRYVECMQKAVELGVNHPKLFKSSQGFMHKLKVDDVDLRVLVLEYVDGKDLYNLGEIPNDNELQEIARQMALIHKTNINPGFVYDSWAIVNFAKEFEKKSYCLSRENYDILEPLYKEFLNVKIEKLPHCYVHGDIISTNVIKDKKSKLWIIDFAVSNYYPRIVDIAVTTCNLCFDENSKESSVNRAQTFLDGYQKSIKLTEIELRALPLFVKVAHAMHILIGSYEKAKNENSSEENEYFINQGRKGLIQM